MYLVQGSSTNIYLCKVRTCFYPYIFECIRLRSVSGTSMKQLSRRTSKLGRRGSQKTTPCTQTSPTSSMTSSVPTGITGSVFSKRTVFSYSWPFSAAAPYSKLELKRRQRIGQFKGETVQRLTRSGTDGRRLHFQWAFWLCTRLQTSLRHSKTGRVERRCR